MKYSKRGKKNVGSIDTPGSVVDRFVVKEVVIKGFNRFQGREECSDCKMVGDGVESKASDWRTSSWERERERREVMFKRWMEWDWMGWDGMDRSQSILCRNPLASGCFAFPLGVGGNSNQSPQNTEHTVCVRSKVDEGQD